MNNKNANLFSFFPSLILTNKPTRINIHTSCNEVRERGGGVPVGVMVVEGKGGGGGGSVYVCGGGGGVFRL